MVAIGALGVGLFVGLGPTPGSASSHREAPLLSADPAVDSTDLYAFRSPDKPDTVTLISNWYPFETPAGGPNFYSFQEGVYYDINVDNDGDAVADVIYRWIFKNHYRNTDTFLYNTGAVTSLTDADLNFYQTYDLQLIRGGNTRTLLDDAITVPNRVGHASMPDFNSLRADGIYTAAHGASWSGQADDPFFLDLRVFDLLYGADLSEVGDDTLHGINVLTTEIQVPISGVTKNGDGSNIIGVWTTAERKSTRVQSADGSEAFSGPYVQVSRLGAPLVNEVVVPVGSKDHFSASFPIDDGQFLGKVVDPELPHLINAIYGVPVPDCDDDPSNGIDRSCDLVPVFLTGIDGLNKPPSVTPSEMLRLNLSIDPCQPGSCSDYSRLGVIGGDNAGFPNGRRLGDDVVDIALQVVEGFLLGQDTGLGDGVDKNDVFPNFGATFPYLDSAHSGSDKNPKAMETGQLR